jgi:hypothetical protein
MSQNLENGVEEELPNTNGIMSVFFFQYKKLYSLFTNLSEKLDMFVWLKYKRRIFIFWVMQVYLLQLRLEFYFKCGKKCIAIV